MLIPSVGGDNRQGFQAGILCANEGGIDPQSGCVVYVALDTIAIAI